MTSMHDGRPDFPAPGPTEEAQPFWDALKRGELAVQWCPTCSRLIHPPRALCADCGTWDLEWRAMSGRGTVYSYVVTHQAIHPAFEGHLPYLTVMVELEEGPRLTSNLVDVAPDEVAIGMPVEVVFHRVDDEVTLPLFRRA